MHPAGRFFGRHAELADAVRFAEFLAAQEQVLVRLRQAALRGAESRARISATVTENDDYQRFIPEVREFFSGEVGVAKDLMQF